ncbi:MAG: ferric reductase-like transmembrane domain-containing protein [Candidatus Moranbacteria bacterium]|nr:ferric reductase-like transmembrane domain-containing protein [Candidatus Moranbacteria bacterium]
MHNPMSGKLPKIFISVLFLGSVFALPVEASVKDSDADGLTDQAESEIYLTNPLEADTDIDGIDDGTEVLNETNPLKTEDSSATDTSKLPWQIGRASGILAFILLTLVVVNGLLMSTRALFRIIPPAFNYETHRFLSWMAILAIIGHFVSFIFDDFLKITLGESLLPFLLVRDFSSQLGFSLTWTIALGIIAFYGILALVITSELRRFGFPVKKWRVLHYTSFLAYLLFLVHGITAGTDSREWWMIWMYSLSGILVIGLTGLRIYTAIKKKRTASSVAMPPILTP